MVANVQFELKGEIDIRRKLKRLGGPAQKRAAKAATRRAQNVVAKQARINTKRIDDPATANQIARNIRVQFASRQSRGTNIVYRVGVLGGAKQTARVGDIAGAGKNNPGGDTFYWRFFEFGTDKQPPIPMLRPAQTSTMPEQFKEFGVSFINAIDKELLKAA